MSRYIQIAFFLFFLSSVNGQVLEPKHTFNIEVGLPNGFSNKPFKNIMQGLVNIAPYYQYAFKNHIIVGAGLRYSYFAINEFKVPEKIYGGMHTGGVFVKAGWEKFYSDHFAMDLSGKVGYTQNYFVRTDTDTLVVNPVQVNAVYFEPSVSFILTADEFSSYRLVVGYGFQGFGFKPEMINTSHFEGYDPKDYSKTTSFLIIGFGFTHYFKPKS